MKKSVKIIALILVLLTVFAVYGCAKVDEAEALSAYKELYPKGYELAGIIYGQGLPYEGEYDLNSITEASKYVVVAEDAPYKTKAELEAAVLQVFSQEFYDSTLAMVLFGGSASDENGMLGLNPRYKEVDGKLYINIKYEQFITLVPRDSDSARVIDTSRASAVIEASYSLNGELKTKSTTVVFTQNGWRLDEIV